MTAAQMMATIVLSAAMSRIRQRIGSARTASRKAMVLRPPGSVPLDRITCSKRILYSQLSLAQRFDPLDQGSIAWIGAHGVAQRPGGILERLAVDVADHAHARLDRLLLRAPLPVQPLLAHVAARLARGLTKDHAVLARQVGPGAPRHDQHLGAH